RGGTGVLWPPRGVPPGPFWPRPSPQQAPHRAGTKTRGGRKRASGNRPRATQHLCAMPTPVWARRRCPKVSAEEATMNPLRTAVLLAGLTALFMGVGYLIGGGSGAVIALLVAAGMNLAS